MKKVVKTKLGLILIVLVAVGIAAAAAGYKPAKMGAYYSSDGTGADGTWLPMSGSGGVGTAIGRVNAAGLYYSSDGTGHDGTWLPCGVNCFGGGVATTATNLAGGLIGSVPYQSAAGATAFLAGNSTTAKCFMQETGTGSAPQAPTCAPLAAADIPAGNSLTNELGSSTNGTASNTTRLLTFSPPSTMTATKVTFSPLTPDNTANLYDFGIYSSAGALLCHTGATAGTTFAPSSNAIVTLSFNQACVLTAGLRYYQALTGNAGTVVLYGTYRRWMPQAAVAPASGSVTTGGVLNNTITLSADSWSNAQGEIFWALHN